MNELKVFESSEFGTLRGVEINGESWLVGNDVAERLEYERGSKAVVDHVDEEDRMMVDGETQSQFGIELGQRGGWLINESGLYSLVLGSKLPNAKKFKRWVTSEVLPAIRKHGGYLTAEKVEEALLNPDVLIRLATELKDEREARRALESKVAEDAHGQGDRQGAGVLHQQVCGRRQSMTRMEDMIKRYGECVTVAAAARIMGRSRQTVQRMLDDGRIGWACAGTMVDVRSMAEYIEAPAQADHRARAAKQSSFGRSRFSV